MDTWRSTWLSVDKTNTGSQQTKKVHVLCFQVNLWFSLKPPFVGFTSQLTVYFYDITWLQNPSCPCPRGLPFTWWGCCGLRFWRKPTELAHFFSFCFCVCFCLYGSFNCVSFHKLSRQLSTFSLCSSGLFSALLALSIIYLFIFYLFFMNVSFIPDIILCGWLGLKQRLTS